MTTSVRFLDQYEPLDVIGNGGFGIIRKVQRKSDGTLNFERLSERDRKQIVAEVYVDRDAGILYILTEYCGGGDLSTIIRAATKQGRSFWRCSIVGMTPSESDTGGSRRAQILHRDLKPDSVFLDENNTVKLGDFGLSKALSQASFANTYVGTLYYMSPELMHEKAYDSKSDIWSAQHFIRNGRIPSLPHGYSQALNAVIRSMLNLNPAMRPSAAQLLQRERLELVFKVAEMEKMLSIVKSHSSNLANKESEILAREHAIAEKERRLSIIHHSKEEEITSLQHMLKQLQAHKEALRVVLQEAQQKTGYSQQYVDVAIQNAITRREAELRVLVARQEEQVAAAMSIREEEIMEAVRQRERESSARRRLEEEMARREEEPARMEDELARREEELTKKEQKRAGGRREMGGVFEDVKNTLPPEESNTRQFRRAMTTGGGGFGTLQPQPQPTPCPLSGFSRGMEIPVMRSVPATTDINSIPSALSNPSNLAMPPASAMKGVVFTGTGQVLATPLPAVIPMNLATPSPAEIGALFEKSPKVGLGFANIFDLGKEGEEKVEKLDLNEVDTEVESSEGERDTGQPPSPSERRKRVRRQRKRVRQETEEFSDDEQHSTGSGSSDGTTTATQRLPSEAELLAPQTRMKSRGMERVMTSSALGMKQAGATPEAMSRTKSASSVVMVVSQPSPPTRIRRPSIRTMSRSSNGSTSSGSSVTSVAANAAASVKRISASRSAGQVSNQQTLAVDDGIPASASAASTTTKTIESTNDAPPSQYDLAVEESLPSPFLQRGEHSSTSVESTTSIGRLPALSIPTTSSTSEQQSSSTLSSTLSVSDAKAKRRGSSGLLLRAAATNAGRRAAAAAAAGLVSGEQVSPTADVVTEDGAEANTVAIKERERERPVILLSFILSLITQFLRVVFFGS
ncbi:hypothetical protein BJ165DRAFT_1598236 [Panaeolus papilionaceus]|nr:hypothetical protein BJ165DRAFT_1598236 [Panaeolus papilionaceus]